MRKKTRARARFFLILALASICATSFLSMFVFRKKEQLNDFGKQLVAALALAFDEYFQRCPNDDELRPLSGECVSSYGFSSSLLESVEVLFLLGMKDRYRAAREKIKWKLDCSKLGWVNRREFFSRAIGSLIGSYLVTGDRMFLQKACDCVDTALSIPNSFAPFVNLAQRKVRMRKWQEGSSILDIISGLPELLSLYLLTKNASYSAAYLHILSSLPEIGNETLLSSFYDVKQKMSLPHVVDAVTVGFVHNLYISNKIKPMKKLQDLLASSVSKMELTDLRNNSILGCLVDFLGDDVCHFGRQTLEAYLGKQSRTHIVKAQIQYEAFTFSTAPFRRLFAQKELIQELIVQSLVECRSAHGFTGKRRNNINVSSTDIQHSSFFGEWMSLAAWLATNRTDSYQRSVFNERGHVLYSSPHDIK